MFAASAEKAATLTTRHSGGASDDVRIEDVASVASDHTLMGIVVVFAEQK